MSEFKEPTEARLWTIKDAASFLQMSVSWVYKAVEAGTLPCVRLGASVRFDPARLKAWAVGDESGAKVLSLNKSR